MSLGLIVGVALVALLAVIIIVSTNKSRKAKKIKFLDPLHELASREGCHISYHDIWSESVIGIDESKSKIFVVRKTTGSEAELVVNLSEIFRCRVAEISRTSGPKEGNIIAFDRIDLVFMNKEKGKPDVTIEFYNANTDRLTLAGELQLAEKWCALVNKKLSSIGK
jgi:hypothetical protein